MAAHRDGPAGDPDPSLGGLDEEIGAAAAAATDPGRVATARREARAYAIGLQRAVYVLTGRLVGAPQGRCQP